MDCLSVSLSSSLAICSRSFTFKQQIKLEKHLGSAVLCQGAPFPPYCDLQSGTSPQCNHLFLVPLSFPKYISLQFISNFLSYFANKQINADKSITSLAEEMNVHTPQMHRWCGTTNLYSHSELVELLFEQWAEFQERWLRPMAISNILQETHIRTRKPCGVFPQENYFFLDYITLDTVYKTIVCFQNVSWQFQLNPFHLNQLAFRVISLTNKQMPVLCRPSREMHTR